MKGRHWLYLGGGLAALLVGGWGVRMARRSLSGGDLGVAGDVTSSLRVAVSKQVAAAKAGKRLTDYRSAERIEAFWPGVSTNAAAHYKVAYALAVASRLTGSAALASKAAAAQSKGSTRYLFPDWGTTAGDILRAGGAELRAAAPGNKQVAALAKALDSLGGERNIASTARQAEDQAVLTNTAKASISDTKEAAGDVSLWIRDGIGLARPDGSRPPWWRTWLVRGGVAAVVLLGARVAFAPQYHAAKAAVGGVIGTARGAFGKVREVHGVLTRKEAA